MSELPLAGCAVAVTRPPHRAGELCDALAAAGASVLRFPTLEIRPLAPAPGLATDHEWVVYLSAEAVAHDLALPARHGRVAAIGPATAAALAARGVAVALAAAGDGSESLLAALAPQLDARARVLLVAGRDGRTLLRDALRARGTVVEEALVYERALPSGDPRPLLDAWREGRLHAAVCSSDAALANLARLLGDGAPARALRDTLQVVVASERAVRLARELGFARHALVADDTGPAALVTALAAWWTTQATPRTRTPDGH